MKKTIITLYAVTCLSIAGCATRDPRDMIEKHLGMSPAGAKVLDEAIANPQVAPDITLLLHKLSELKQDRNLTLGILLMTTDPDLIVTNLMTSGVNTALFRAALSNNTTSAGATFVRPEDISNITIETNQNRRTIGTFDWTATGLLKGTCRFVAKGNKLEYLGFLRKNSIGTYDCETIFSRFGNICASQQMIRTKYFAAIEPRSEATKALSRADQIRTLRNLLITGGIGMCSFPIRDQALPLVYCGEREDRDKVIAIIKDSEDWGITMSSRAVEHFFEMPLHKSIEQQIKGMANTTPRHIP